MKAEVGRDMMKLKFLSSLALVLSGVLSGCFTTTKPPEPTNFVDGMGGMVDEQLSKQISDSLAQIETIKPGMTREELLKVFEEEGGIGEPYYRTFCLRSCPCFKVGVEFIFSDPKQTDERPTDKIAKISKPYLEGGMNID